MSGRNTCVRCGWHYLKHDRGKCPGQRGKQGPKNRFKRRLVNAQAQEAR